MNASEGALAVAAHGQREGAASQGQPPNLLARGHVGKTDAEIALEIVDQRLAIRRDRNAAGAFAGGDDTLGFLQLRINDGDGIAAGVDDVEPVAVRGEDAPLRTAPCDHEVHAAGRQMDGRHRVGIHIADERPVTVRTEGHHVRSFALDIVVAKDLALGEIDQQKGIGLFRGHEQSSR